MDEQKTCERCGDDLRETLHSGGVKFDHFACGTIVYESGEGLEGLRCVRRQRDWSVAEVARLRVEGLKALRATADTGELAMNLTVELDALRGRHGNLLAVVFGDGGQEAERLGDEAASVAEARVCLMRSTINEAGEREACLRRKVVNLTEAVKKTIPAGLWLELVVALRENWEDTPEHWREINAIIRRAEVCNAEAVPDQGSDAAGLGGEADAVEGDR